MTSTLNQLRLLCSDWNALETDHLRSWDLYNVPLQPLEAPKEEFLTVGVEKNDEQDLFASDQDALKFVRANDSLVCRLAAEIHDLADDLRREVWGNPHIRTPPTDRDRVESHQDETVTVWVLTPNGASVRLDPAQLGDIAFCDDFDLAGHIRNQTGFESVTIERTTKTTVHTK